MRELKIVGAAALVAASLSVACKPDTTTSPSASPSACAPALTVPPQVSAPLTVLGQGVVSTRYTAEVDVRGSIAYTTTWNGGAPRGIGNAIFIWDVAADVPKLLDSVIVAGATTLGDVAISDDGTLLVVATERTGGSIVIYDLAAPAAPKLLSRFTNAETDPGVHTAEIGRVNGRLYAFLSIDPRSSPAPALLARLVIIDLGNPAAPQQVFSKVVGSPYVHDVFVRDGFLFLATWNTGIEIWDLGGAGNGSPAAPRVISSLATLNGSVHNIWWFHDPVSGTKAYAFVGEEGPGGIGVTSNGDVHVVDVCDMAHPKEVAFYHLAGAGTHNFSMDESRGILYAAYYNGGVRALDVRGDLSACLPAQRSANGRCDLGLMGREIASGVADRSGRFVWGVVYRGGFLYLSDMVNGFWKLKAIGP